MLTTSQIRGAVKIIGQVAQLRKTKQKLRYLIGKLAFAANAVPADRLFTR